MKALSSILLLSLTTVIIGLNVIFWWAVKVGVYFVAVGMTLSYISFLLIVLLVLVRNYIDSD